MRLVFSYLAGTKDTLKAAAITLRAMIKRTFDETTSFKWTPTADELGAFTQDQLPEELFKFLNVILSGQDPNSDVLFNILNWSGHMQCRCEWRVENSKTCSYILDNWSSLSW